MSMNSRTTARILTGRLSVALLLAVSASSTHAQQSTGGGPIGGDSSAGTVRVNPGGNAPNGNASWSWDPGTGTVSFGMRESGDSGGGNTHDGGGGTGTGGPAPCVRTGVIITGEVHLPKLEIATSPEAEGIVGLPSWFWSDAYTGNQLRGQSVSGYYVDCVPRTDPNGITYFVPQRINLTLSVDFWPVHWAWDFGDRHLQAGDCGDRTDPDNCPPAALGRENSPSVSNVYQSSSAAFPNGYPVDLSVTFAGRIGSPDHWTPLGPFVQQVQRDLPVREVQSVLVE